MASIASYVSGELPHTGDFVRNVHPDGPVNGLTVLGVSPSGLITIEDITGRVRTLPARRLSLITRGDLLAVA